MARTISDFYSCPLDERGDLALEWGTRIAERGIGDKVYVLIDYDWFFVEVVVIIDRKTYSIHRATPLKTITPRKASFYAEAISIDSLFSDLNN